MISLFLSIRLECSTDKPNLFIDHTLCSCRALYLRVLRYIFFPGCFSGKQKRIIKVDYRGKEIFRSVPLARLYFCRVIIFFVLVFLFLRFVYSSLPWKPIGNVRAASPLLLADRQFALFLYRLIHASRLKG